MSHVVTLVTCSLFSVFISATVFTTTINETQYLLSFKQSCSSSPWVKPERFSSGGCRLWRARRCATGNTGCTVLYMLHLGGLGEKQHKPVRQQARRGETGGGCQAGAGQEECIILLLRIRKQRGKGVGSNPQ